MGMLKYWGYHYIHGILALASLQDGLVQMAMGTAWEYGNIEAQTQLPIYP